MAAKSNKGRSEPIPENAFEAFIEAPSSPGALLRLDAFFHFSNAQYII